MTQVKTPVEPRTVSMYSDDWRSVERVADTSGVRSLSAALRLIIREFERRQKEGEGSNEQLIIVS